MNSSADTGALQEVAQMQVALGHVVNLPVGHDHADAKAEIARVAFLAVDFMAQVGKGAVEGLMLLHVVSDEGVVVTLHQVFFGAVEQGDVFGVVVQCRVGGRVTRQYLIFQHGDAVELFAVAHVDFFDADRVIFAPAYFFFDQELIRRGSLAKKVLATIQINPDGAIIRHDTQAFLQERLGQIGMAEVIQGECFLEGVLGGQLGEPQGFRVGIEDFVHRLNLIAAFDSQAVDEADVVSVLVIQGVQRIGTDDERCAVVFGQAFKA